MCIFFCGNPQTTKWIELQVQRACRRAHQLCPVNPHQECWHESPAEPAGTAAESARPATPVAGKRAEGRSAAQLAESAAADVDIIPPGGRSMVRLAGRFGNDPCDYVYSAAPAVERDLDDCVHCPACHKVALAEARYCDLCGEPLWLATTAAGSAAERAIRFVARGAMMVAFALFAACLMSFLLPPHSQFGLVLAIVAFAGFLLARQSTCSLAEPARDPAAAPAPVDAAPR